jgi:hypothetical protein
VPVITTPQVRRPPYSRISKREALLKLHAGGIEDRADGTRRPPLLSNHFAQVGRIHPQFQHGYLFTFHCPHRNLVGMIHERFGDGFD